jgi:DNA-binding transcriptional LysR family regulator
MVLEAENAEAEIAAYQGHPSGRLRVAVPHAISQVILKAHIPEFLGLYPDVDLQLQLTDRALNPVSDDFDVVIRVGTLEDSSVIARKITDVNAVLLASRGYAEERGIPTTAEELEGHNVIGLPLPDQRSLELTNGKERVKVAMWSRFACNDPLVNLELVERGIAIAPVSLIVARSRLLSGELIHVLPRYQLYDPPAVYALYAGRTAISPKISVFLDFMSELARRIAADPSIVEV